MAPIPAGSATIEVSILSPNRVLNVPPSSFLTPLIPGTTYSDTPCFSFLLSHIHPTTGKRTRLIFDLGIRADWHNLPPATLTAIASMPSIQISTPSPIFSQLISHGISPSSISGIILSHSHFDHIGDPSLFPLSTKLIVGPGFQCSCLPCWPKNPASPLPQAAFEGRQIEELTFATENSPLHIAGLSAIDYFSDGSLYLLNTPGHAAGHISALVRTTLPTASEASGSEATFMLLAGDVAHHAGELRPSKLMPLPAGGAAAAGAATRPSSKNIYDRSVEPAAPSSSNICRCGRIEPFYRASATGGFNADAVQMRETVEKIAVLDADPNVFVVLAHDRWVLDVVDLFPQTANGWKFKGWDEKARWRFLQDFD